MGLDRSIRETAVVESKLESASFVAHFHLLYFKFPPPLNHRCELMSFFGFLSGLFVRAPSAFSADRTQTLNAWEGRHNRHYFRKLTQRLPVSLY